MTEPTNWPPAPRRPFRAVPAQTLTSGQRQAHPVVARQPHSAHLSGLVRAGKHRAVPTAAHNRSRLAGSLLLGALASGALAIGSPALAHAAPNACVDAGPIDFSSGSAHCSATGPGSTAIAIGADDTATADGTNDHATDIGSNDIANATGGNNDNATAIGNNTGTGETLASAGGPSPFIPGNRDTATVLGNGSSATAGLTGATTAANSNNRVTVVGNGKTRSKP